MPHVDVKYQASSINAALLSEIMQPVADVLAQLYSIDPDYVTVELVPQGEYTLNRNTIDLELSARPDTPGLRQPALGAVADQLLALALEFMASHGISGDAGAFCRVFQAGAYSYGESSVS